MINSIKDIHDKELTKQDIDNLFYELNRALRKKFKDNLSTLKLNYMWLEVLV